jgi:class 3 adenylate cyclase
MAELVQRSVGGSRGRTRTAIRSRPCPGGHRLSEQEATAILMSDAVGFSRWVQEDEAGTLRALRASRLAMAQIASQHCGRIVGGGGDSILARVSKRARSGGRGSRIPKAYQNAPSPFVALEFCVGIHLGDVIAEEGTIFGDAVNLAARLQSTAEIGGILISRAVYEEVSGKLPITFRSRGRLRLKNLSEFVACFDLEWRKSPRNTFGQLLVRSRGKSRDLFGGSPLPDRSASGGRRRYRLRGRIVRWTLVMTRHRKSQPFKPMTGTIDEYRIDTNQRSEMSIEDNQHGRSDAIWQSSFP